MISNEKALKLLKSELKLRGVSPRTFESYTNICEKFLNQFDKIIEEVEINDVKIYLSNVFNQEFFIDDFKLAVKVK